MEKLQRLFGHGPVTAPIYNSLLDVIDIHSEAIEAHSDDLESLTSRVRRLERRSGRDGDELLAALEEQWGCRIPPKPLRWRLDKGGIMTPADAADIILAQQDKLLATLKDEKLRVWTRGVVALLVGALREHGREDR